MKRFFFLVVVCLALSSCAPTTYYQLYQTQPISDIKMNSQALVYEDENCRVSYNFWKEYGDMGFVFYNKTSENIYIHLDECFFISNGEAFDYTYVDQFYFVANTGTYSPAIANAKLISKGSYAPIARKRIVCIPSHASKIITEFDITKSIYHTCDMYLNPGKNDPHSVTFNETNTPLSFGNRLTYSVGENETLKHVNNDFYVSKISNYSYKEITTREKVIECDKKKDKLIRVFKETGPNQFYIQYSLFNDEKKH